MSRPYSPYSPYPSTAPTERLDDRQVPPLDDEYEDYDDHDYSDDEADVLFYDESIDRRWIWVAGVAGSILLVAVVCTVVILSGGDSGSVSAPVTSMAPSTSQPALTSAPPTPSAPQPATSLPPTASLAPETVTTVTPSPSATATPSTPAPAAAAAPPAPNTVTYRVTGNRQLVDLVTVIYTDNQGALQTEVNVALPWAKTITLDPGVTLSSVTATSVAGQLNCSVTDGSGATIAQQNNNSLIATCTK
jgi:hypothetical protein